MVGSDVFNVASSHLWRWWNQTLPATGDQHSSPLLASDVSLKSLGPTTSRLGGRLHSFRFLASKMEERWDCTVSSCPSSRDGVELRIFAGGSGKARKSGGLSPCMCSSWVHHPVDPNLCFDATLLPLEGAGHWWGGPFRYTQNVYPSTYLHFSAMIMVL